MEAGCIKMKYKFPNTLQGDWKDYLLYHVCVGSKPVTSRLELLVSVFHLYYYPYRH